MPWTLAAVVAATSVVACGQRPQAKEPPPVVASPAPAAREPVPKIVDLGADKCIPCKAMAPILEALRAEHAGRLDVEFIDVWKNPGAAEQHGIRTIPTQIFYAADGRELGRHEGFLDREGILAGFKQLGVQIEE